MTTERRLPVGTQFTPALLDLRGFLLALLANSGNKKAIETAVWSSPVRLKAHDGPSRRQAALPVEAAVSYGLLDEQYRTTQATDDLAQLQPPEIFDAFAKHILLHCNGIRLVEAAREMNRDGLKTTGDSLAEYLTDQGFPVPIHNTGINSLRMWLAKAGIFSDRDWQVNDLRLNAVLGIGPEQIAGLVGLNEEQQAFLRALCRVDPPGECSAAEIRVLAEQILSRRIQRDSLPKRILTAIKDLGYIDFESGGTSGGKATRLWTLPKFEKEALGPFLEDAVRSLDPVLTAYYQTTPAQMYAELESSDTSAKGRALEAYAVHIMRLMGFRFVGWRKRAKEATGNAEVDVVMTGLFGNSPTRWQVQCKNTPHSAVDLEDVAKEVGLLPLTKATHVLVITSGRFTRDALTYAREVMSVSSITIFLLDGRDFRVIKESPAALATTLRQKAIVMAEHGRASTMWGW